MREFGGLAKVMPIYAAVFVVVTMSSIGVPGTNGFVGEFMVIMGTFVSLPLGSHGQLQAALATTGVILAAVYMLSLVQKMFFGPLSNPKNKNLPDLNVRETLALAPLIALIFVIGFITFIIFVALFTVAFGRLFCGWACPQTVFMEQVFRRIEYAIEGDWKQQQALNKGPMSTEKMWKKTLKHALFFGISFLISNTFLGYIIGSDELLRIIREPFRLHLRPTMDLNRLECRPYETRHRARADSHWWRGWMQPGISFPWSRPAPP